MPKKKIVKKVKVVKPAKEKKVKTPKVSKLEASYASLLKPILAQLIVMFEASLLDAFKQYVESRMASSKVASAAEFMAGFKHTIAANNITEERLLSTLDDYELEYLKNADKVKAPIAVASSKPAPVVKVVPVPKEPEVVKEEPKKNATSVFDSLDLI